jgi:alkanesulfonate monooxygenase SsuD/methylene tetrahydromethanopterin reductase-like flavin-dependent oxidoreductase (luciferase family)
VGGAFPQAARRAVRYGDGWFPIGGRGGDVEQHIPEFRRMAEEAGRDPASLEVSLYAIAGKRELVDRYRGADVDRVIYMLPPTQELEPMLDELAGLLN